MKKSIFKLFIMFIIFFSFLMSESCMAEFQDVPKNHKNYNAIMTLVSDGIAAGYDDGLFKPEREITRTEFCALLSRSLGYNDGYKTASVPFRDVKNDYWGISFISFCYESGLINGMGNNLFAPADKVTTEQAVKMLVCAAGKQGDAEKLGGIKWYSGYMSVAESCGMLKNVDAVAGKNANRASVAQLICNAKSSGLLKPGDLSTGTAVKPPQNTNAPDNGSAAPEKDYSSVKVITVDAGHNYDGKDKGARIEGTDYKEEEITWQIADKLRRLLEEKGYTVVMTRKSIDSSLANTSTKESLQARVDIAHNAGADLFISIHCNIGGGIGSETYCYKNGGYAEKLAKLIQKELAGQAGMKDRGVKTADFYVVKNTEMPAVLVETGFMDNEHDIGVITSEDGQQKIAEAICSAVCQYSN